MVAIYGKNFCASAKDALRKLALNILGEIVMDPSDFLTSTNFQINPIPIS